MTRSTSMRTRIIALACVVVAAGALIAFLIQYGLNEGSLRDWHVARPPVNGLDLDIIPQTFDPLSETMSTIVRIDAGADFYPNGDTTQPLARGFELSLEPNLDGSAIRFLPGSVLTTSTLRLELSGRVQDYPFDTHRAQLHMRARYLTADGSVVAEPHIPIVGEMQTPEGMTDWELDYQYTAGPADGDDFDAIATFNRSPTTKYAAIFAVLLTITLGTIALLVVWWVVSGRRKAEWGMGTWFAALIFALVSIRLNLPGAPPIGSWIDVVAFFPVQFALMLSLAICVSAWLRQPTDAMVAKAMHPRTVRPVRDAATRRARRSRRRAPGSRDL